ncbi:MAG: restriction endonuclease [Opitutaceae bacterium]|nr:restriction endonuclease [Opitutaceae bacterium]
MPSRLLRSLAIIEQAKAGGGMLTPNEVHLVVGILTMASTDQDVEIELGSQVMDQAAGTTRDVDIMLRYQSPTGPRVIAGIEVKAHTRPLDIEHVEQLVIKLSDVRAGTPSIVSASGYTPAAVKKAAAHRVELLSLVGWNAALERIDTPLRGNPAPLLGDLHWSEGPHAHIELDTQDALPTDTNTAALELWIEEHDGTFSRRPAEVLTRQAAKVAADNVLKSFPAVTTPATHEQALVERVSLRNQVRAILPGRTYRVKYVRVTGRFAQTVTDGADTLRYLVRHDGSALVAACCAMAMSDGTLTVLAYDHRTRVVTPHTLTIADRSRTKIKGVPLVRQTEQHRVNLIPRPQS